jgi:hypothetical protein
VAYITNQDVEIRLIGKVRFTDDLEDENRFPRKLLQRLIKEAEGAVERDLSPRYAAPWKYPPMDYLLTSAQNSQDDGFHGVIVVSDNGDDAAFPGKQITDPAETFWNGKIDE